MSVNGVNSTTHKKGFFGTVADSVVTQGKNMLVGGAIGLATGKVVSLAAPVSRAKIADEVFDHYVKNNKDNIADSIKQFENLAKNENLTKEQLETAANTLNNAVELVRGKAKNVVEEYFKKARKDRSADDVVALAKKAAKKTQSVHIMGTLAGVGILAMMFSELFDNILPKKNKNKTANAQTQTSNSALQTHQG
ncbi:TPA: hypothetical protein IAA86_05585 [Candidatus Galligastranaerophilus intestinavium]|uniref:Uncharacterized protein n=1 Tax=Candidatus Galligastranaerophilus intestinavium TaxID=2840836 RepID=A0A9D1FJR4_9BACT|nr:hypothetical protein [Candidatus Galligastranaerophilus intestinavium]